MTKIQLTRRGILMLCATAITLGVALDAADAKSKSSGKLTASRAQVGKACDSNGGIAWGTQAKDTRYGCVSDSGWVECSQKGECTGGRASDLPKGDRSGGRPQ